MITFFLTLTVQGCFEKWKKKSKNKTNKRKELSWWAVVKAATQQVLRVWGEECFCYMSQSHTVQKVCSHLDLCSVSKVHTLSCRWRNCFVNTALMGKVTVSSGGGPAVGRGRERECMMAQEHVEGRYHCGDSRDKWHCSSCSSPRPVARNSPVWPLLLILITSHNGMDRLFTLHTATQSACDCLSLCLPLPCNKMCYKCDRLYFSWLCSQCLRTAQQSHISPIVSDYGQYCIMSKAQKLKLWCPYEELTVVTVFSDV